MDFFSQMTSGFLNLIGRGRPETDEEKRKRILTFLEQNLKLSAEDVLNLEKKVESLAKRFNYPLTEVYLFLFWIQKDLRGPVTHWEENLKYGLKLAQTYGRKSCLTLTREDLLPKIKNPTPVQKG